MIPLVEDNLVTNFGGGWETKIIFDLIVGKSAKYLVKLSSDLWRHLKSNFHHRCLRE